VLADFLHGRDGTLDVAGVVEGVKNPEDIHAVLGGLLHKMVNNVVAIVAVAQQVLATQKHLQPAVRHQRTECPQPLPRILVQKPDTRVIRGTTPTLHTPEPRGINISTRTHHVLSGHPGRHQRLVSIPKGQLCDPDLPLRIHAVYHAPEVLGHEGTNQLRFEVDCREDEAGEEGELAFTRKTPRTMGRRSGRAVHIAERTRDPAIGSVICLNLRSAFTLRCHLLWG
jgi:hypothetical protein